MDIVIISEFCEDFSETDNDRFLYLAKMLSQEHAVEIITSSFRHTTKSQRNKAVSDWPFRITFIEEPGYPRNVCVKRFQSHYIWGKNLLNYIEKRTARPDVVYCAVPSLTGPNLIAKYCEKNRIRFVIDVQDLWPEAFQMIVNIPVVSTIGFSPFAALANGVYKRANAICAVSDTYCKRALSVNRKCKKVATVYLGTDLSVFDHFAAGQCEIEKKKSDIWLAYCGTLGSSYDLTCVIDALAILDNKELCLIVMGDGPKMKSFKEYAGQKGIRVLFTGRLPYHQMCAVLQKCDITVNPIEHGAAQSIINKHADYAASGLPVVSTQESDEYRNLVETYQMGFNCNNNDAADLAERINQLVKDKALRTLMGNNARRCAEEKFDRKNTYEALVDVIVSD